MKCDTCGVALEIVDVIKSDGTTNRPFDRVIAQCPKCKAVVNTIYNPQDWYTKQQLELIERLFSKGAQ